MIKPTVGRVVLYCPGKHEVIICNEEQRLAAIIVNVLNDRLVNLCVFDADGDCNARHDVPLRQPEDEADENGYCEWMEYQIGQAAKTEEIP